MKIAYNDLSHAAQHLIAVEYASEINRTDIENVKAALTKHHAIICFQSGEKEILADLAAENVCHDLLESDKESHE